MQILYLRDLIIWRIWFFEKWQFFAKTLACYTFKELNNNYFFNSEKLNAYFYDFPYFCVFFCTQKFEKWKTNTKKSLQKSTTFWTLFGGFLKIEIDFSYGCQNWLQQMGQKNRGFSKFGFRNSFLTPQLCDCGVGEYFLHLAFNRDRSYNT